MQAIEKPSNITIATLNLSQFIENNSLFLEYLLPLQSQEYLSHMEHQNRELNRLKVVLVEKRRTNKWLAEQLGKDPGTVSKWCTNTSQPSLEMLLKIADILNIKYTELIQPN